MAERNTISHSDQAGVFVAGSSNVIRDNVTNEVCIRDIEDRRIDRKLHSVYYVTTRR